jgi:flavorubredoxin
LELASLQETGVATLVPDRLYALGQSIENDGRISWLDPAAAGYEPLNVYLLTEGRNGLVIDSQVAVIGEAVETQARQFDLDHVTMMLTRCVEFDSVGNAERLLEALPVKVLYGHYPPEEWVYIRRDPPARLPYESRMMAKHDTITLGPEREVAVLPAPLRLLACAWLHDPATGTLFTSDGFSHARAKGPSQRVVTEESDETTLADVLEHLSCKYDWLETANTGHPRRMLDEVFTTYDVERIAPISGCVLSGRAVVERHRKMLDEALRILGEGRNGNGRSSA